MPTEIRKVKTKRRDADWGQKRRVRRKCGVPGGKKKFYVHQNKRTREVYNNTHGMQFREFTGGSI